MPGHKSHPRQRSSAVPVFGSARLAWPEGPKLVLLTDVLICLLAAGLPFIMGGREAWGHRFLITLSLALGGVWCLHRMRSGGRLVLTAVEPLILAGLLLVWFQTVPVSQGLLHRLSAEYQRLLAGWSMTQPVPGNAGAPPAWSTPSLIPSETQHAFWMLLAYGLIGVVVVQRLETERDCERLLKLVGVSGILMAIFAILQLVTSNDKFFWFYRQPYTGTREILKGSFTNRNHFAQFLALSAGPLIWWMLAGREVAAAPAILNRKGLGPAQGNHSRFDNLIDARLLILLCATGGVIMCIMLSLSRGGMVAVGLVCSVTLAGLWRSGRVRASLALVMLALGVITVGGLIVFGQERVEERVRQLATVNADQIDQSNARRMIWKADFQAIRAFPLVGTGVGSHRFVYPIYMEELADFQGVTFSHAESSYVHLALETGIAGLGLLLAGLLAIGGRMVWHLVRRREATRTAALSAVVGSLTAGVVHAAADFIWYCPAIVVTTILLCAAGLRLCSGFLPQHGLWMPRLAWLTGGAACLVILCATQPELAARVTAERAWYGYLNAQFDAEHAAAELRSVRSAPDDDGPDADTSDGQETAATGNDQAITADGDGDTGSPTGDVARYASAAQSADHAERIRSLNARIRLLMTSLRAQPGQPQAALHLAGRSLDLFQLLQRRADNPLDLINIRDTVLSSQFRTQAEMQEWLQRAFGNPIRLVQLADNAARRSLAACPTQYEPYELLITTGFIRDPADRLRRDLLAQAVRLGRHSPDIRYAAGFALLTDGLQAEAVAQWSSVFHSTAPIREMFCRKIGRGTSVEFILQQFDPSTDELDEVLKVYADFGRRSDIEKLLYVIAEKSRRVVDSIPGVGPATDSADRPPESGAGDDEAAPGESERPLEPDQRLAGTSALPKSEADLTSLSTLLLEAARVGERYGIEDRSEELLRLAGAADPSGFWPRRSLAALYYRQKQFAKAEPLFAWCSEQEPGDTQLEDLRRECRKRAQSSDHVTRPASFRRHTRD